MALLSPTLDPKTLLAEADCYLCYAGSGTQLELMKLALLARIMANLDPSVDTSPQALLSAAGCFSCYASSPFMLKLLEIGLLRLLAQNWVGTGQQIVEYVADPTAEGVVPANINSPAIAVSNNPALPWHNWDTANHVWI